MDDYCDSAELSLNHISNQKPELIPSLPDELPTCIRISCHWSVGLTIILHSVLNFILVL